MTQIPSPRLASLDILRGFDLFLLLFLQPVVVSFAYVAEIEASNPIISQLDHEVWEGFRCWDLIMPLFLFMAGASMPFSLSKFKVKEHGHKKIYLKVFRRFIILWLAGMVVQGNLLALNPSAVYLYSNTLQAIAAGYLIGALILLNLQMKWQILATFALLAIYSIPMHIYGSFMPDKSFAAIVDINLLGRFRDGSYIDEFGLLRYSSNYNYTWIWSSLTFGATVMSGAITTQWLCKNKTPQASNAFRVIAAGTLLVLAASALGYFEPIVKRIWTSSMTIYSSGLSMILLGIFYWWIDCKNHTKGLNWLKIYGMNAITAYILGEVVNFRSIANSLTFGLQRYIGDFFSPWLTFCNCLIIFLILAYLYRRKIFLKI